MRGTINTWFALGILAILILVGLYIVSNPQTDQPVTTANTGTSSSIPDKPKTTATGGATLPAGNKILSRETFTLNNIEYALERKQTTSNGTTKIDQQIIRTIGTDRIVLVPSVKTVLPELGNLMLVTFSLRKDPPLIVFVSTRADAKGPFADLYRFDIQTLRFTKLFVSRFLPYYLGADDSAWLASDRTKFLSLRDRYQTLVPEARGLYLVDLAVDQARLVASAKDTETLTQSLGSGNEPVGVYRWIGTTQIEYSVFNTTTPMPRTAIATRTVTVNLDQK